MICHREDIRNELTEGDISSPMDIIGSVLKEAKTFVSAGTVDHNHDPDRQADCCFLVCYTGG
jgi:hypothetical protein